MPISAKGVSPIRFYHTTEAAGTTYHKFKNETLTNCGYKTLQFPFLRI